MTQSAVSERDLSRKRWEEPGTVWYCLLVLGFSFGARSEMRGRCDAALEPWELELTVEKGTTESIASCHCLCVDSCVHSIGIELCAVFLGEWRSLWSRLDREEADSAT